MMKAQTISVKCCSREDAEQKMADQFTAWMTANPKATIFHIFEPVRKDWCFTDPKVNYCTSIFTFFYTEQGKP